MFIRLLIGIAIGALAGATLGYFGKCSSGTCPLTANPFRGAMFGALLGVLFAVSTGHAKNKNDRERGQSQVLPNISEQKQETEKEKGKEALVHVNSASDFEKQVLKAKLPCLVDFFSLRCPPCRILGPTIEELAKEYKGRAVICKVSLDHAETRDLPRRYEIRGIPTVIFFNQGEETERLVGLMRKQAYSKILDEMIETKTQSAKEE